jgi:lysophospholipase L1-like esterase
MTYPYPWSDDINVDPASVPSPVYATRDASGNVVGLEVGGDALANPINYGFGGIAGLGDSITANGVSGSVQDITTGHIGTVGPRNWLMWASLLSGGRLVYAGVAATGGYTTQQIIDVHLPRMLTAIRSGRVSTVCVLAGTNDVGAGTSLETIKANLTTIYQALLGAGARVVACTLTPRESSPGVAEPTSFRTALQRLNAWIRLTPLLFNGIQSVDFHALTTTTESLWVSGYNSDNIHPTSAGAKAMGQALSDLLMASAPVSQSPLLANTSEGTASTGYSQAGNPLMTDTDANGTPDGVTTGGSPTMTTNTTGTGLKGNYCKAVVTQTASSSSINFGNQIAANQNDVVVVSARLKTSVEATSANADFRILSNPSESTVIAAMDAWDKNIPDGSVVTLFTKVPSLGAESNIKIQAKCRAGIGASIEVAQLVAINLSTAGLG